VKTHYELLGLAPTADADAIKKAFRREIARYHPDKVIHLGAEFQEMAATRAAELTVAYKTLTDPALRAEYDASVAAGLPPPHMPAPPPPAPTPEEPDEPSLFRPPTLDEIRTPPPPRGNPGRFAEERADRDVILRRAIAGRVQVTVEALYGKVETPTVRGFDLAMVPVAKTRFLGTPPPRVLVKVVGLADTAAITEAWNAASRARVHAGRSPVVVLLFSRRIGPANELSRAWDATARQRKAPDAPEEITVIVVDVADWSCRLPPNPSAAARKLADQICA
jgi:hypothetical protein